MRSVLRHGWTGVLLAAGLLGVIVTPAAAQKHPLREAYFGETHVHTSWSFDAYIFGNTLTGPADAYKYAKGETIKHPLGYPIKITTPLDWMGVTDHSEYVGTIRLANTPGSAISKLPIAEKLKVRDLADIQRIYLWLGYSMIDMKPVKELVSPEVAGTVWKENVAIANQANQPGKFTAFCSYEWTSTPNNRNMHRNVFFKDCAKVPDLPFSSLDSQAPEDLWNWMDGERRAGNELLAISHNANLSDGIMFPQEVDFKGRPIDKAWAESRDKNERLTEIKQIKGWTKNGQTFEKVFDVTWSGKRKPDPISGKVPAIGTTVNIAQASYANTIGSVELKTVWTDPEFDPSVDAFYYARVLEIPTPRWTTIQAKQLGITPPDTVAATIQERAWSSPIWYTPTAEARKSNRPGTTVADLRQRGATALDQAQLTALIVGKSTWVRNNATGSVFQVIWSENGRRLITNVDGKIPQPGQVGDVMHSGELGSPSSYAIKDGKIVTSIGNQGYEVTVYKLGDKYFGARSNEFGYANYEVVPTPANLVDLGKVERSPF